ncbi:MAG: site-specific integrase [Butyrivibrio sp.]|nr:site-specific integrase [Butyrivibrio sp.]
MASIKKRGNSYQIRICIGRTPDGKQKFYNESYHPTAKSEKKALQEVHERAAILERELKSGLRYEGNAFTFYDFAFMWRDEWAKNNLTTKVIENYFEIYNNHVFDEIGGIPVNKITALQLQKLINGLIKKRLAAATVKHIYTAINAVMRYAFKMSLINENPCERIDLPKIKNDNELHFFNLDQAKRFLNALDMPLIVNYSERTRKDNTGHNYSIAAYSTQKDVDFQFKVYFYLALYGGFRRSELLALTWNDIDFDENSISINKAITNVKAGQKVKDTKSSAGVRKINLPDVCFKLLRLWYKEQKSLSVKLGTMWTGYRGIDYDNNFVFINGSGNMMSITLPRKKFKAIIKNYNSQVADEYKLPDIRLHDLRHTSATLLLANGTDIETVSKRLGHSKTSVTLDVYGHALEEMDKKAAATLENIFYKNA